MPLLSYLEYLGMRWHVHTLILATMGFEIALRNGERARGLRTGLMRVGDRLDECMSALECMD